MLRMWLLQLYLSGEASADADDQINEADAARQEKEIEERGT